MSEIIKPSYVSSYSPPSPQFWGDKKIKVFQSPPELEDLGDLYTLQSKQIDT